MNDISSERRQISPLDKFREQFDSRRAELAGSLPAHIPFERFKRVCMNAVSRNPDLLSADRASLLIAVATAAADGLLCDGRDAALVIFNTKQKYRDEKGVERERWVKVVQYMPMIAGILKKLRNSGQLSTIAARVVYGGDKFRNWIDDSGEHIEYEASEDQDRNIVRCVFAMAKLKDGGLEVEVLKPADIEKIRNVSRSKDKGPWVDWWEEMAEKSAIRRLSKRLPISTDLDDLIRRDDTLYDLEGRSDRAANGSRPRTINDRLDALAGGTGNVKTIEHDPNTGEVLDLTQDEQQDTGAASTQRATEATTQADGVVAKGAGSATSSQADPAAETNDAAKTTAHGGNGRSGKGDKGDAPAQAAERKQGGQAPAQVQEKTKAAEAGPEAAPATADKLSPDDEALLADLLDTARNAAAQGRDALDEFEDGLTAKEQALMGPQMADLRRAAKAADQRRV